MSFKELELKNRSYRRFFEDKKIEKNELVNLVDIARNTASGANNQPLRYKVVCDEESNKKVFDTLKWAGALPDWDGPVEGERPAKEEVKWTLDGEFGGIHNNVNLKVCQKAVDFIVKKRRKKEEKDLLN